MTTPAQFVEASVTRPPDSHARTASKKKVTFLIWTAIFPTVLICSTVLSWLPFEIPRVLSVFVTTAITVPVAVYLLVPTLCRLLDPWVYGESWAARDRDTHEPSATGRHPVG